MNVLSQLLTFWSELLYGIDYIIGDEPTDTPFITWLKEWTLNTFYDTSLGTSFKDFIMGFFSYLPYILSFLTLALAVFLFCFMMYKIIKLFTNTI